MILNFKDKIDQVHATITLHEDGSVFLESVTEKENFGIFKRNKTNNQLMKCKFNTSYELKQNEENVFYCYDNDLKCILRRQQQ